MIPPFLQGLQGGIMQGTHKAAVSPFIRVDLKKGIPAHRDADSERLHPATGCPLITPERLMRARLVQILFPVRSERRLKEQMRHNLLFRGSRALAVMTRSGVTCARKSVR